MGDEFGPGVGCLAPVVNFFKGLFILLLALAALLLFGIVFGGQR